MAKAIKKNAPKKKAAKPKKLKRTDLVTNLLVTAAADVNVLFNSGLGQLTATLFRNGILINMQSISTSGTINFTDVQSRDVISINGVCSGTAAITISVPTRPATPDNFAAGIIIGGYILL